MVETLNIDNLPARREMSNNGSAAILAEEYDFPIKEVASSEDHANIPRILPKERRGRMRTWSEMSSYLPDELNPHHLKFFRSYFRAQLRIAEGKKKKAQEIFKGLVKKPGYNEFETQNKLLLAVIDIGARGETKQFTEPSSLER